MRGVGRELGGGLLSTLHYCEETNGFAGSQSTNTNQQQHHQFGGHQTSEWLSHEVMRSSLISADLEFAKDTAGKSRWTLVASNQPANGRRDASLQYKSWTMLSLRLR